MNKQIKKLPVPNPNNPFSALFQAVNMLIDAHNTKTVGETAGRVLEENREVIEKTPLVDNLVDNDKYFVDKASLLKWIQANTIDDVTGLIIRYEDLRDYLK